MDSFAKFAREIHAYNVRKGLEDTDADYADIAHFVNVATGRGDLGNLEGIAPVLNAVFFSPRYWSSRIQLVTPFLYKNLTPPVRRIAIRKFLQFAGATGAIMALMRAAGGEISFDFNDADFLKVRFGSYHYDMGSGITQNVRFAAQLINLAIKRKVLGEKPKFGEQGLDDLTLKMLRSKLAPIPGAVVDWWTGKDFKGDPVTLKNELWNNTMPIIVGDMITAYQKDGTTGAAMLLPSVLGVGVSVYDKKEKSPELKAKDVSEDLIKRGRAGEDIKPEVLDKVKYGELTKEQAKRVLKEAAITDEKAKEESKLSHGNLQSDLEALKQMPADKQRELLPVLIRRVKSKGTPVQREALVSIQKSLQ